MKNCPSCKTIKEVSKFSKNKSRPDGLNGFCKVCMKDKVKSAERTPYGVIRHIYASQKRSSLKRELPLPSYTLQELYEEASDSVLFQELYLKWVHNNYDTKLKPSYDRLDYTLPYSFSNIQLMTWGENASKQHSSDGNRTPTPWSYKRKVAAIDLDGEILHVFESVNLAGKYVGLSNASDIQAAITRDGTAGGFKWKYL